MQLHPHPNKEKTISMTEARNFRKPPQKAPAFDMSLAICARNSTLLSYKRKIVVSQLKLAGMYKQNLL